MIRNRALVAALCAPLLLAACNGVERKTYLPNPAHPLRTVGLVSVPKTDGYAMLQLGFQPAMMFGAVGGLVAGLGDMYKGSVVNEALARRGFDAATDLEKALESAIQNAGYEVIRVSATARGKDGFVQSYASLAPRADLFLDATIAGIGFESASMSSPWQPILTVPVRLVSGSNGDVLYADTLTIGTGNVLSDVKHLSSDSRFSFNTYTDVRDRADLAVEGFRHEFATVAEEVGRSIGRGSARTVAGSPSAAPVAVIPPPASPAAVAAAAPLASSPPPAVVAATPKLGRCELSTVRAMKRDGATESEIQLACQATLEETRTALR